MSVRVVAASSWLHPVREGEALPSLERVLKEVSREYFRRVDRFIQLALLGSGRCVAGQVLHEGCGIYLGSGFGPIGSNIATQEQMLRDREIPKPYNFVNTLGASAGFHIAKNLGLTGQNFFISRRGASFEAALETAVLDLEMGVASQALVGVVEDVTLPLDQHRRRRGLPEDTLVAEGSHWLLLNKDGVSGKALRMEHFEAIAGLEAWLKDFYSAGDRVYWTLPAEQMTLAAGLQQQSMTGDAERGIHDNPQAGWVTEFVLSGASDSLFLIGMSAGAGYRLLHLGP